MTPTDPQPKPAKGAWDWTRNPKAGGAATIAALLIGLMLVGLEFALDRDGRGVPIEDKPAFYAVCGLALAALTWALGLAVRAVLSAPAETPSEPPQ
jgi:hypothetical protein